MPNWVTSKVFIEGNPEDIGKIIIQVYDDEYDSEFSLNKIIPMPKSMNVEPHGSGDTFGQLFTFITDKFTKSLDEISADDKTILSSPPWNFFRRDIDAEFKRLKDAYAKDTTRLDEYYNYGKQKYDNIQKYGSADWYDWSNTNWGTKWDTSEACIIDETMENSVVFRFDTAWACPYPVIEKLSEQYPNTTVSCIYADEDIGSNCGYFQCKNGKIVDSWYPQEIENPYVSTLFAAEVQDIGYYIVEEIREYNDLSKEEEAMLTEASTDLYSFMPNDVIKYLNW